jgi:Cupredoxin-like domain
MTFRLTAFLLGIAAAVIILPARSTMAQEASYSLTIHDDRFEPSTLNVKAGIKFKLNVKNARKVPAEFESAELNREKVVPPGQTALIYIGPLAPSTYQVFDDFHQSTRGRIVAK